MSILETFYLLFKTKGSEEASKDAKRVTEAFVGMGSAITNVVASAFSINKLFEGLKDANNYALELGQASQMLNVNVSDLDAWSTAVVKAGGTAAGFQSSLRSLANTLGTSGKVALQALPHFADTFAKLNQTQAFMYGKSLGLDEGTIMLLQRGRREVEATIKQQRELGVVQKEDIEIANHFKNQMADTAQVFRHAFMEANREIIPTFDMISHGLQKVGEFFGRHANIIVGGLAAIIGVAGGAAVAFGALKSPVTIATLALGAFGLVYDDVLTYIRGGDSILGRAIEQFKILGAGIRDATMAFDKWLGGQIYDAVQTYKQSPRINAILQQGQEQLAQTQLPGVMALNNNSILNRGGSSLNTTFTGDIVINTQASTPDGIADALKGGILSRLDVRQAGANHDDGVWA